MSTLSIINPEWRLSKETVSLWIKREEFPKHRVLTVYVTTRVYTSRVTRETVERYVVTSPHNPLPVKGEFESKYSWICNFLLKQGFTRETSRGENRFFWIYSE